MQSTLRQNNQIFVHNTNVLELTELLSSLYYVPFLNGPIDASHKQCTNGHKSYGCPCALVRKVEDCTTVRSEHIEAWLVHGLRVHRIILSELDGHELGSKI